ncbi:MAG: substrate-binding domain-containing protein [Pseudobutyrivibrio sp.]|nr:substrate-binding domain-containing protein [Pseudobutyrivibrio sp.]
MKKNVKKLIGVALTIVSVIASLTACGSASSSGGSKVSGGGVNIYYSVPDNDDTYRASLLAGIEEAANSSGANLTTECCGNDTDAQAEMIKAAADSGKYDAIICRLVDTSTALQIEIAAGDLPVIYVNNEPKVDYLKEDKYVCVGSYEQDAGKFQAQYVWEKLGQPAALDIIILEGAKGHTGAMGRTNAVKYFFRDNGVDANIVFMDFANWTDTEAYEKLNVFKMTGQNFDAIFCNNDTMALGAIKWLKANGYSTSDKLVAGVDATADGCAAVSAGDMFMTVLQDAAGQGAKAVEACIVLGKGGSIKEVEGATEDLRYIWVPFVPVDASNVSQYM